jgi:hypothetical protein
MMNLYYDYDDDDNYGNESNKSNVSNYSSNDDLDKRNIDIEDGCLGTLSSDTYMRLDNYNNMLPLSGIKMANGYAPIYNNDVATKTYVDTSITKNIVIPPDATTTNKGVLQLSGDLSGTAASPLVAKNAITKTKMANSDTANILLGSNSSNKIVEYSLGNNLAFSGSSLQVTNVVKSVNGNSPGSNGNINIPSAADATTTAKGVLQLSGDLSGTAASPLVAKNAITKTKMANSDTANILLGSNNLNKIVEYSLGNNLAFSGSSLQVTNVVKSVNGNSSDSNGNINIPAASDATTTSKGIVQLSGDLTGTAVNPVLASGVVTKDKLANSDNSNTLLGSNNLNKIIEYSLGNNLSFLGSEIQVTDVVLTVDGVSPDINGNITTPAPPAPADSTTTNKGILQLSGDLTGTATNPTVANNAITKSKMANSDTPNILLGSNNLAQIIEYTLGNNLAFSGSELQVQNVVLTVDGVPPDSSGNIVAPLVPDATTTNNGVIQLSGDLTGTASNPLVSNNAITKSKMANSDNPNILLGSNNLNQIIEYSLGNNLSLVGSELQINNVVLTVDGVSPDASGNIISSPTPDATDTSKGVIQLSGDLTGVADNPVIADKAITKTKMANSDNPNILLGSDDLENIVEYTLGDNLLFLGSKLVLSNVIKNINGNSPDPDGNIILPPVPNADSNVLGVIQLNGDLSGSATSPLVANGAITKVKMANSDNPNILLGSNNLNQIIEYSLGNNLSLVGSELNVNNVVLTVDGILPDVNGNIVSQQIPDSTTTNKGIIQLSGDLTGTSTNPIIANNVITKNKIANSDNPNILLGSNNLNQIIEYSLGDNLSFVGSSLNVYNFVKSVNGILPDASGNVVINLANINTLLSKSRTKRSDEYLPVSDNDLVTKSYVDSKFDELLNIIKNNNLII